jgi:hypothetical protein
MGRTESNFWFTIRTKFTKKQNVIDHSSAIQSFTTELTSWPKDSNIREFLTKWTKEVHIGWVDEDAVAGSQSKQR